MGLAASVAVLALTALAIGREDPPIEGDGGGEEESPYSQFLQSLDGELPFAPRVDSLEEMLDEAAQIMVQGNPSLPPAAASFPPNPLRLALQSTSGIDDSHVYSLFGDAGLEIEEIEPELRPGWTIVRLSKAPKTEAAREAAISVLTSDPDVLFVSPVLESGAAWALVTQDVLLELVESADATIYQLLADHPGFSLAEEQFGGMPLAYRLTSDSQDGIVVLAQVQALVDDASIVWAEPDCVISAEASYIPNDPGFASLWGFRQTSNFDMDVDLAWNITRGAPGVNVLILDCGTDGNHPDLNEGLRRDFTGTNLNGCDSHGTAVAGCVTARIDNNLGTVGVAPLCRSMSARIFVTNTALPCGNGGSVQVGQYINAMSWGISNGARISNASLSLNGLSPALDAIYSSTRNNGMVHFSSAGNASQSVVSYPGSLTTVQEVAALRPAGGLSTFSNHSIDVISAPGESIFTTDRAGVLGFSGNDYATMQGTSFASPYVAGIAALMLTINPALTPAEVETILRTQTTDLGAPGRDTTFGWGMANANRAVAEAQRRAQTCQQQFFCHATTGGYGLTPNLSMCSPTALACGTPVTLRLQGLAPAQTAWIVIAGQLQPTQNPMFGSQYFVDPTPLQIVTVSTDAQGQFCLPNLANCGTLPIFLQAVWVRPGQSTLGLSEVVRMDFGPLAVYRVGSNQIFGRIQDAIAAAQATPSSFNPVIEVDSGTYPHGIALSRPMQIREAPGATAVVTNSGTLQHMLSLSAWNSTSGGEWSGIDIVAAGTLLGSPIQIEAIGTADMNMTFRNMNFLDVAGVSATAAPFMSITDSPGPRRASVNFIDVGVNAINFPYGAFFEIRGDSKAFMLSGLPGTPAAPGSRFTLNTSAKNLADVQSTANPGLQLLDALVKQVAPREEMLVLGGGTIRSDRCKFETSTGAIGVARNDASTGSTSFNACILDARSGTQQSVCRIPGGGTAEMSFMDSAVLFDASTPANNAAVDASNGGRVVFERSTVSSSTSNPAACAISGPTTSLAPATQLGKVTGRIDQSIFKLPGSHAGVVRGLMGSIALAQGVENVRFCQPLGFPGEAERLPGMIHDVDPVLAADGFHLASNSAPPKRVQAPVLSADIDSQPRGFMVASSTFGCDHTAPTFQTGHHVGAGFTFPTIQAAINSPAVVPPATIIVHGGVYNENVSWSKPVDIVEAFGEGAVLRPTSNSGGAFVLKQGPWPTGSSARWDGIDVECASPNNVDVVDVTGTGNGNPCSVRFENCRFTDTASSSTLFSYFRVQTPTTTLALHNTIVDPQTRHYLTGFLVSGSNTNVFVANSYVSFDAGITGDVSFAAQLTFDNCEIVDRGSQVLSVKDNSTLGSFIRTRVKTKVNSGTPTVGTLGSGACGIAVWKSFIDATDGTGASPFMFTSLTTTSMSPTSTPLLNILNSSIVFHSGRTALRCAVDARKGGQVTMVHGTIRNIEDNSAGQSLAAAIHGPDQASDLKGSFHASVFDLPGSTRGIILNHLNQTPGTVSATASENVRFLAAATATFDRMPGTIRAFDPQLASDGFHLTSQSNTTMQRALASGETIDIDSEQRPWAPATQRSFGCDEIHP